MKFQICVDNVIDIITNSSSELFVIDNNMTKQTLVELLNSVLPFNISEFNIEERLFKDYSPYEQGWKIQEMLEAIPESDHEEFKAKYLTNPKFYGIAFDRDEIYRLDRDSNIDVRAIMSNIGFEMIDGDY